jgi:hypothetical protein
MPIKPYSLAGLESGFSVPEADAMSTAPRRQGNVLKTMHEHVHMYIQSVSSR